jgi:glycosyltransferase involved in cell wall biosynthesis
MRTGDRVRVLHFTRFINRYDFIDTIVRFADASRFEMMACTLTDRSTSESPGYERDGIRHWVLDADARPRYPWAVLRLARLLVRERIDVLHTHHYEESALGAVAATLAGVPMVLGRHYHADLYLAARGAKRRLLLGVERFTNHRARVIIVPSRRIRELLLEQGVPDDKVAVVPYGFDFEAGRYRLPGAHEAGAARRELGLDGGFVIGNFGRHDSRKGQDDLLRAFARLVGDVPAARLVMVGDGPANPELRALVRTLGVEHAVVFTGWRQDPARVMAAVDVVAHPTLVDAFPQVVIEALVAGKPLVATDASGPCDQVEHGRTGLLIPRHDPVALHGALRWCHEHPDDARRLGAEGRRWALEALDIRRIVPRYEACYDAALMPPVPAERGGRQ